MSTGSSLVALDFRKLREALLEETVTVGTLVLLSGATTLLRATLRLVAAGAFAPRQSYGLLRLARAMQRGSLTLMRWRFRLLAERRSAPPSPPAHFRHLGDGSDELK